MSATRTWIRALKYFDGKDLDRSLYAFEMIPRTPKMAFNLSMVHAALGDLISAVDCLQPVISTASASAVEYFQLGVLLFALEHYGRAHQNFSIAYLLMAGHSLFNYNDVGLDLCLHSCEVLFNCAMCLLHLGKFEEGIARLVDAQEQQQYPSQVPSSVDVFSIPLSNEESERSSPTLRVGYWRVFEIPSGTLYRPVTSQTREDYQQKIYKTDRLQTNPSILSESSDQSSSEDHHRFRNSPLVKIFKLSKKRSIHFFK